MHGDYRIDWLLMIQRQRPCKGGKAGTDAATEIRIQMIRLHAEAGASYTDSDWMSLN